MNHRNRWVLIAVLAWQLCPTLVTGDEARSLDGTWRFQLDRADAGVNERWFERRLPERIQLPGALQNQGFGDDITSETKWTGETGADRWLKQPVLRLTTPVAARFIRFVTREGYRGQPWAAIAELDVITGKRP